MKLGKLFSSPLGVGSVYSPMRKEVAWVVPAIAAAGSLLSSYIGAKASKSAQEQAAEAQREFYNRNYARALREDNESVVDTKRGQRLLNQAKEYARRFKQEAKGASAVMGSTVSAEQKAKDSANNMVSDTIANMAVMDDAKHERAQDMMTNLESQKMQMDVTNAQNKANNVAQAAGAASNAIAQGAGAWAANTSLKGGGNNSTQIASPSTENTAKISSPQVTGDNIVGYRADGTPIFRQVTGGFA